MLWLLFIIGRFITPTDWLKARLSMFCFLVLLFDLCRAPVLAMCYYSLDWANYLLS
jgi:hypothetical protein